VLGLAGALPAPAAAAPAWNPAQDLEGMCATLQVFDGSTSKGYVQRASVGYGFTTTAAERVCGAHRETLSALVAANLVHERVVGGAVRCYMLETVREYAVERLLETGEAGAWHRRHAEHYAAGAEAVEDEHPASRSGAAWQDLEAEHDNFRAALDWSRDRGEVELQLRIVGALAYFWATSDHLREGGVRLDAALRDAADAPAALRARALTGVSRVAQD